MSSNAPTDPRAFLEHASWMRGFAMRLAHDVHDADDLVQETWLELLRERGNHAEAPRRFLAGVLRHRWLGARRAGERRRDHESRVESRATAPRADEVLEKAELARALVESVLELDEPYRSTVLLRYGEDLAPRAIADRQGVSIKTVESRLQRAVASLRRRTRLRHGFDERPALALLAAPSVAVAPSAVSASWLPISIGVLTVNAKIALALAVVLGGGALVWFLGSRSDELAPPTSVSALAAPRATAPERVGATMPDGAAPPAREALAGEPRSAISQLAATAPAAPATPRRGRVLDPESRPAAAVELVVEQEGREVARAISSADGAFEISAPNGVGRVRAADRELETLVDSWIQPTNDAELLVIVAPYRALAGSVVDDAGSVLAGVSVRLELPAGFMGRFSAVLDHVVNRTWEARSDDRGRFELPRAPIVAGARLVAALDGYATSSIVPPDFDARDLTLVLARPDVDGSTLAGRVVDRRGRPIVGAALSVGGPTTRSDVAGEFRLARGEQTESRELVAVLAGYRPARFVAEIDDAQGVPLFPSWIELVLDGAPLELAGVVVDAEGKPRAGVHVWLADPTPFGTFADETHARIEFLLAQGSDAPGSFDQAGWSTATADSDGRFRVPGLLERAYSLVVYDVRRCEKQTFGPFEAGRADLRIVFPHGDLAPFAGRIVTRAGEPLADVNVFLQGETYGGVFMQAAHVVTGEDGRFSFDGIGGAMLVLMLRGESMIPAWRFFEQRPVDPVDVVIDLRCNAKVELGEPALADAFEILDPDGEPLDLHEIGAHGVTYRHEMALVDGRSVTFGVSEVARTLVLRKSGEVVGRVALSLARERLNLIGR